MIMNQFDIAFKSAITEVRLVDARLGVLGALIQQAKDRITGNPNIGEDLISTIFPFRDLTLVNPCDNLFAPNDAYSLTQLNLVDEVNFILSRESLFQIAQAYEIAETYLYNQVSEFIRLNSNLTLPVDYKPKSASFSDIRLALKRLNGRTNNRHLLGILRKNSNTFQHYETTNIYNYDFEAWFEMFSEVRHSVTHGRLHFNTHLQPLLPYFEKYFSVKVIEGEDLIFTNVYDSKEFLSNLGDYIFFVYKCVTDNTYNTDTKFSDISHIFYDPNNNTLLVP